MERCALIDIQFLHIGQAVITQQSTQYTYVDGSTIYYICKSKTSKTELTLVDTGTNQGQRQMNQKSNKSE